MPKYTEDQVKQAIDQADATKNVKAAAKAWGIPYSTLRHRLEGIGPKYKAQSHRQRLSPAEEEHLASWVMSQRILGLAPTLGQLREFAQHIAANSGDDRPIGQNWATGFLRRNPKVQTVKCKAIDFNRPEGDLTEQIKDFFERLALPVIKNIPRNIVTIWMRLASWKERKVMSWFLECPMIISSLRKSLNRVRGVQSLRR